MKILVNAYTQVNVGDDLFLKILAERYPDVQFVLFGGIEHPVYSDYGIQPSIKFLQKIIRRIFYSVNPKWSDKWSYFCSKKVLRNIAKQYDAYLSIGGSVFMQQKPVEDDEFFSSYPYGLFKHTFIIGANFGPFSDNRYLAKYAEAFKNCDSIVFRDSYSKSLFPAHNNVKNEPDIVLQLKPTEAEKLKDSVGISVIDLSFRGELSKKDVAYTKLLVDVTNRLLQQGKQVYLFSFCEAEGDERQIARISNEIHSSNLHSVCYKGDIDNFLSIYSTMEAVISSRFHSMILSLVYNQKMLPLIYSKKQTHVLNDLDFNDPVIDLLGIDSKSAEQVIELLYSCKYVLPLSIRQQSEYMFHDFDKFISDNQQ